MKVLSGVRVLQCPSDRSVPPPQWRIPEIKRLYTVEAQHLSRQSDIPQGKSHITISVQSDRYFSDQVEEYVTLHGSSAGDNSEYIPEEGFKGTGLSSK